MRLAGRHRSRNRHLVSFSFDSLKRAGETPPVSAQQCVNQPDLVSTPGRRMELATCPASADKSSENGALSRMCPNLVDLHSKIGPFSGRILTKAAV